MAACGDEEGDDQTSATPPDTAGSAIETTDPVVEPTAAPDTTAAAPPATDAAAPSTITADDVPPSMQVLEPVEPLKVVLASASPVVSGTVAIGAASGIFEQLGLDVDFEIGGGSQVANLIATGDVDLTDTNLNAAAGFEIQGKDVSAIWSASGGGLGFYILGSTTHGPASADELQDFAADGCSFGVTAPGSTGYGQAKLFMDLYGLDCELVELGDTAQIVGAVVSGRVDFVTSTPGQSASSAAIQSGELRILVDFGDPAVVESSHLPQFTERVWLGLAENLEGKRDSVVRFLMGLKQVNDLIATTPSADLADLLLTVEAFKTEFPTEEDRQHLSESLDATKAYLNWEDGFISEENWQLGLDTMSGWDIPDFDATDPARSYEALVDMSFYEEAVG